MNSFFKVVVKIKKFFIPTSHDKYLKKLHIDRLNFYNQFIKKGDLCYDIGANVGDRTQIFLELGASVVSIEPQASCCEILKKRFGNKIALIQKGVGSKKEIKDFYISNQNQLSTFSAEWIQSLKTERFKESEWNQVEKVEIDTLDNIIAENKTPQFMKIDVEGFELEVFKGLTKQFHFLSFEFAVPDNLNNLIKCIEQLQYSYSNLLFNYAVMDNTYLELENWVTFDVMLSIIKKEEFLLNSAGDIYVKMA